MLSDVLQVLQALVLAFHDGAHATQSSAFQLLAPIEGVTKLHQPDVVLGHVVNEVFGCVHLTQSQLVMVPVVQDVHEVSVERVNIVKLRKLGQNGGEFVVKRLLGELDLSGVKPTNSGYFEVLADDGRSFPLGARENYVDKVLRGGHHSDLLEIVITHPCWGAEA